MSAVAPITDHYVTDFNDVKDRLPGNTVPWLQRRRETALEQFARLGFPSQRQEDWKYTSTRSIEKHAFQLVNQACLGLVEEDLGPALMSDLEAHRLVFVNGLYAPQLSKLGNLPPGAKIASIARVLNDEPGVVEPFLGRYADSGASGFSALNMAYMADGLFFELAGNTTALDPVHLLFVSTAQVEAVAYHTRNLLVLGKSSQAKVIEHYINLGDSVYLNNVATEIVLAEGASVDHYRLQQESIEGYHVATLQVHQERHSCFTSNMISVGGSLVRNNLNVVLDAEGAECHLNGLYVGAGTQHVDNHTRIDHKHPHGTSREFYKGVLSGRARAVFNGSVYVHPGAQKTDAEQTNKNLLLSQNAEVNTKPQLEIYADDVKCSHGATVGQLDEQMLFYLCSRGIAKNLARGLLTSAFAHDIVERIAIAALRARVAGMLTKTLPFMEAIKESTWERSEGGLG